ncbi:uncharacterized protein CMC5_010610 [Chondromyces crocatus]|uniref:Uncharacterized protein n=1 Tax=Chondromyces crocatus TaxID=52 RepID=A0A0K1E7U8_CHOCO|nr:uncharacterized protein CMC5_010610 [Chondromyces crocatus]
MKSMNLVAAQPRSRGDGVHAEHELLALAAALRIPTGSQRIFPLVLSALRALGEPLGCMRPFK